MPNGSMSELRGRMPFTVVIPARNAAKTLSRCLEAVYASKVRPDEVIVVNDGSDDETESIAGRFSCRLLTVNMGKGPMEPRFEGARHAGTPVLVFVDADICVKEGTFSQILRVFADGHYDAVTGSLTRNSGTEHFYTHFKNEYMNYIFGRLKGPVDFLYGSIWAVRTDKMRYFKPLRYPFGSLVSDSEMGLRIRAERGRILLHPDLEVEHIKEYPTALSLLRNDFIIPFMFSRMWLRYRSIKNWRKQKRLSHATAGQAFATFSAVSAALSFMIAVFGGGRGMVIAGMLLLLFFMATGRDFSGGFLSGESDLAGGH